MRSRRRSPAGAGARLRGVPARSRMTVRHAEAPLPRSTQLAAVLRTSREVICDLEGQLDALLATLRDPAAAPDVAAADRLHGAAAQAGSALAALRSIWDTR